MVSRSSVSRRRSPVSGFSVPSSMPAMPQLVSVQRATPGAGAGANQSAFLSAGETTNARAAQSRSGHCQLVTMLLPEGPAMTTMPYRLCRSDRPDREHQGQKDQNRCQDFLHTFLRSEIMLKPARPNYISYASRSNHDECPYESGCHATRIIAK
jgi:hypothetical protein